MEDSDILVVDDDESICRLCAQLLGDRGYIVHSVSDGEDALEQAAQHNYQIILLDLRLPGMDGLECLRRLKSQGCRAEIVMVTGYGNVPAAVEAMKIGACDFIEKPFQTEDLELKVEEILARRTRAGEISDDPIVAYIQRKSTEINSRKDVALRLGVSMERVSGRIQEVTGMSFREFLHACRLDIARGLLETTELDISAVAARTGFNTLQHFSRVFRKRTGISPKNYRLESRAQV